MSRREEEEEEKQEDERRLYQCARKYEKIIKQFDELIEMMNNKPRLPKRRKLSSSCRGSSNATVCLSASSSQPDNNKVIVQTMKQFLHDLEMEAKTDSDFSVTRET